MIEQLQLKNFTAFDEITLEFSPKINVIIGENGTGKTHLLKAAYALANAPTLLAGESPATKEELSAKFTEILLGLFRPVESKIGKLRKRGAPKNAELHANFALGQQIGLNFHTISKTPKLDASGDFLTPIPPIFIPTKEILSLAKCLSSETYDPDTIEAIYDRGYIDLARQLLRAGPENPDAEINADPRLFNLIPRIVQVLGGRYSWKDGAYTFQAGRYVERASESRTDGQSAKMYQDSTVVKFKATSNERYSTEMTAEGFRKLGILHDLILNGAISPGESGPLFWDEPESNLNPNLIRLLVEILLELARNGQQIILATHDYVLLKWFDILLDEGKEDQVRFHVLRQNDAGITAQAADNYQGIPQNAIAETFSDLYDAEIQRALGDS